MRSRGDGRPWPRPALERRLDLARVHRLTVVAAPPGFGKTSLLRRWAAEVPSAWLTVGTSDRDAPGLAAHVAEVLRMHVPGLPRRVVGDAPASGPTARREEVARAEALASNLGRALDEHLRRPFVLVLDDVHQVEGHPAAVRFLEALMRQAPASLAMVMTTRTTVPFTVERLRQQGNLLEFDGATLTLDREDTAAWLTTQLGPDAARLTDRVHELTAGWAAATRLAIESLRDTAPERRAERLRSMPGEASFEALAGRLLAAEPPAVRQLLRTVTPLAWFTPELCTELGVQDADAVLASLRRRGLFLEPVVTEPDGDALIELAREHLLRSDPLDPVEREAVLRRAAAFWRERGRPDEALRCLVAAHDGPVRRTVADGDAELLALLREEGHRLVTTGHAELVTCAVGLVRDTAIDGQLDRIAGTAAQTSGDWELAQRHFERAVATTTEGGPLDAGLAWRLGLIHHLRGDLGRALAVYARGVVDEPTRETGLLLAWKATVYWLRGDSERGGELAADALAHATVADDPQALAAAHTVLAMLAALDGDRRGNDAHYVRALDFAEAADDVMQIVRIRANRSSHHLEEGDFETALAELDIAIGLAESTGYGPFAAVALANKAEVALRRGQLEEAADTLAQAAGIWRRIESRMVCYPLNILGELQYWRGDRAAARAAHEEALAATVGDGDLQGRVPALAGLARVHLDEDPERAFALASEAVAEGQSLGRVEALVVAGAAARECSDRAAAVQLALEAVELASVRRDPVGLATSLELQASLEEPDGARSLLDRAVELWREVGDPIGLASTELARAAHMPPESARRTVLAVRERMRAIGCRRLDAAATGLLAQTDETPPPLLEVRLLGHFRLSRDGTPVPLTAWQSRKARDLFKVLVVRRGRPLLREQLQLLLWPGEEPPATANRLNVAISTVRSVLDPDRRDASDRWVVTTGDALRLSTDGLAVDVTHFLADARRGLELHRVGRGDEAAHLLRRAEASYVGDVLEEDVYEQWAVPLREEARATYIEVAGALASHARAGGHDDGAVRYLLRILERDPYDEGAHLELVSTLAHAGHHGEARRRYLAYDRAMRELEIEPAPYPRR